MGALAAHCSCLVRAFLLLLFVFSSWSACPSAPNQERLARLWRFAFFPASNKQARSTARPARAALDTREDEANMTEPAGETKEEAHTFLQSYLQLLAALLTGAFNSLACLLLLAPPITLWLAWKHPYIVLPPAIAYYFLRYACLMYSNKQVAFNICLVSPCPACCCHCTTGLYTPCGSDEHTSCCWRTYSSTDCRGGRFSSSEIRMIKVKSITCPFLFINNKMLMFEQGYPPHHDISDIF